MGKADFAGLGPASPANETGVTDFIDPLGGSYAIETLTTQIETRISEELEHIEKLGGVVSGIEQQYFQMVMTRDAYEWQKKFSGGEIVRVGANIYRSQEEETKPVSVYRADRKVEGTRAREIEELKKNRDNKKVEQRIDRMEKMIEALYNKSNDDSTKKVEQKTNDLEQFQKEMLDAIKNIRVANVSEKTVSEELKEEEADDVAPFIPDIDTEGMKIRSQGKHKTMKKDSDTDDAADALSKLLK